MPAAIGLGPRGIAHVFVALESQVRDRFAMRQNRHRPPLMVEERRLLMVDAQVAEHGRPEVVGRQATFARVFAADGSERRVANGNSLFANSEISRVWGVS